MATIVRFEGQHWVITPTARAVNEPAPANISEQKWTVVLSGVGIVDLSGITSADWRRETLLMYVWPGHALFHAINQYGIPKPPGPEGSGYQTHLQVEHWAPFAALSSIFDRHHSIDAGYAVDRWRVELFSGTDFFSGERLTNLWGGFNVDVAVRDSDAVIHRLSYHVTLVGRIRFRRSHTNVADEEAPPS